MVKTKGVDYTVKKWERRATVATEDYKAGIQNPRRSWREAALAASETWKTAIQEAIARDAYKKGIEAVDEKKWKDGALNKGATRYADGVRAAVDLYKAKMSKVLSIIESVELTPRGPRGSDQNYERVKEIGRALHDAKLRGEI